MNLNKHLEYFDPINDIKHAVHVIGVGAMGSRIAELLVRLGLPKLHIWDFDIVEDVNITNQYYTLKYLGATKQDALEEMLKEINPNVEIVKHGKWKGQLLGGYIFLAVDSIELRKEIVDKVKDSQAVKGMFDTRMRLEDAQSYGADWTNQSQRNIFINSMQFTDEEGKEATPVSACGTTLSVASTVVSTAAFTVSNFINLIRTGKCNSMIFVDAFNFTIQKF